MQAKNFVISKSELKTIRHGVDTIIQHSAFPKYLSYVLPVDVTSQFPLVITMGINLGFSYLDEGKVKISFLIIKENNDKASTDVLSDMLNQQVEFYVNYLKEENQGIDRPISWMPLKDYSYLTPGLKIIEFRPQNTFIVSYRNGISSFMNEADLFDFLTGGLRYSKELIQEGSYTIIDRNSAQTASNFLKWS